MTAAARRKYLPAEGYRLLVLLLLRARGGRGASKGEVVWETRANHYMATRVLRELDEHGFIWIDGSATSGYVVRLTAPGQEFLESSLDYGRRTFGEVLRDHFRFGRVPDWAQVVTA